MWDESMNIYPVAGGEMRLGDLSWHFPTGSRISFAGIQYEEDKYNYDGAQIPLLGFDQLEQFTEGIFFFMLSRNRSASGVRPYVRGTCNPDPDSFLRTFIDWWIAEDGYADLDRAGQLRWFVRLNRDIYWGDSRQELIDKYGAELQPKSVTFIPATVYDNQILLREDPGYLSNLMALDYVERQRRLGDRDRGGNWNIRPASGLIFNRGWFKPKSALPARGIETRFWDLAATERDLKGNDPSFTAGVKLRKAGEEYIYTDVFAAQIGPAEVERNFVTICRQDAEAARRAGIQYRVRWEVEPGSAGKREARRLVSLLDGIDARGVPARGDKYARMRPLSAQAEAGNVFYFDPEGKWSEMWLNHMHNQEPGTKMHNDIADASTGAYDDLRGGDGAKSAKVDFYNPPSRQQDTETNLRSADEVEKMLQEYEDGR